MQFKAFILISVVMATAVLAKVDPTGTQGRRRQLKGGGGKKNNLEIKHKDLHPKDGPHVHNMCMTDNDNDVMMTHCDGRDTQKWHLVHVFPNYPFWQIKSATRSDKCVHTDGRDLHLVDCDPNSNGQLFEIARTNDRKFIRFMYTDSTAIRCMDVFRGYINDNPGWQDLNMIANCFDADEVDEHLFHFPKDEVWDT